MDSTKVRCSSFPSDGFSTPNRRSLLEVLGRLLVQLGREIDEQADSVQGPNQADRWEDENCFYIESLFPQGSDWTADLSVVDGKVYIRIEK